MARRSRRIQEKRVGSKKPTIQGESGNSNLEDVQAKQIRKAKKAKTASTTKQLSSTNVNLEVFRRIRGKRGLLEKLAKEAPLDVLLEVFKHLEPRDILHLARTSKGFYKFLMTRSSSPIWREARKNIPNLPPLPNDLNEPQYVSLLFDNHCYACLRSPCDNVIWECRVRCHKNCMSQLFINKNQIISRHSDLNESEFAAIIKDIPYYCGLVRREYGFFWFAPMFERLLLKHRKIQRNKSAVNKWNKEKEQNLKLITSHATQCRIWDHEEHNAEQETLRNEYRQKIVKRLSASGWGPEELNHEDFLSHPLLKPLKTVTKRTWNKLKPQLVQCLQALKDKRLEEERRRLSLRSRYELLGSAYEEMKSQDRLTLYPPIADLILSADLGAIDDMIWNTSHDQQLTKSDFINALHNVDIAEFSQRWVEEKRQELEKVLQIHTFHDSDLRSIIFLCQLCGQKTWVPNIYMHPCSARTFGPNDRIRSWNRPEFDPFYELNYGRWRTTSFPYHLACRQLREIMALCGNPELETIEDLERENPLFECLGKRGHNGKRYFARWMEALSVSMLMKNQLCLLLDNFTEVVLATIDDDTKSRVLAQEQTQTIHIDSVVCKHCPPGTNPCEPDIRTHLHTKHGIDPADAKRNVDWCYSLQANVFDLRSKAVILD